MNRFEKSDVPFVPSQIAQPEGGSIVTPSAPRLNAEGGGNQATTVLAGVSGALAPDVAMIMTSTLDCQSISTVPEKGFGGCDGYHKTVYCIRAAKPRGFPAAVIVRWPRTAALPLIRMLRLRP